MSYRKECHDERNNLSVLSVKELMGSDPPPHCTCAAIHTLAPLHQNRNVSHLLCTDVSGGNQIQCFLLTVHPPFSHLFFILHPFWPKRKDPTRTKIRNRISKHVLHRLCFFAYRLQQPLNNWPLHCTNVILALSPEWAVCYKMLQYHTSESSLKPMKLHWEWISSLDCYTSNSKLTA